MTLLTFIALWGVFTAPQPSLHSANAVLPVQGVCPSENDGARTVLVRFINSPSTAEARLQHGWGEVKSANLRLLTKDRDTAVCQFLKDNIQLGDTIPREWAFYEADGVYFVQTVRASVEDAEIRLGWSPLFVFSSSLRFVGSYAT